MIAIIDKRTLVYDFSGQFLHNDARVSTPWAIKLAVRLLADHNQTHFARAIGVAPQTVRRWLHKDRRPSVESIMKIKALADKLGK